MANFLFFLGLGILTLFAIFAGMLIDYHDEQLKSKRKKKHHISS